MIKNALFYCACIVLSQAVTFAYVSSLDDEPNPVLWSAYFLLAALVLLPQYALLSLLKRRQALDSDRVP